MRFPSLFLHPMLRPAVLLLTTTACAFAHHEPAGLQEVDEFAEPAFQAAFTHSFTGVDHLLAALAVGWICTTGGRARNIGWICSFLMALAAGMFAGLRFPAVPGMELGVALSLLLLAFALRKDRPATRVSSYAVITLTGLWHGLVHGSEFIPEAPAFVTAGGLLLGTATTILAVTALGSMASRQLPLLRQGAALSLALAGSWFLLSAA